MARDPGSRLIHLSGTMPVGRAASPAHDCRRGSCRIRREPSCASSRSARSKDRWRARARAMLQTRPADRYCRPQTVLAEHASVPLSDDIRLTNKNSENLHAELLLLLAAHEKAGRQTLRRCAEIRGRFFQDRGHRRWRRRAQRRLGPFAQGSGYAARGRATVALCRRAALGRAVPLVRCPWPGKTARSRTA